MKLGSYAWSAIPELKLKYSISFAALVYGVDHLRDVGPGLGVFIAYGMAWLPNRRRQLLLRVHSIMLNMRLLRSQSVRHLFRVLLPL